MSFLRFHVLEMRHLWLLKDCIKDFMLGNVYLFGKAALN